MSAQPGRRVRVLFSSTGGEGHVQPMLPLAGALRDQGHDVLWAAPAGAHNRVAGAGLEVRGAGRDVTWCLAEYARRWPKALELPMEQATLHMFPRLFGTVAASAARHDLTTLARDFGPDLIVHEAAELAAPAVAADFGVPSVAHGIGLGIRPTLVDEAYARASAPTPVVSIDICPPSLRPADIPPPNRALPQRSASLDVLASEALPENIAHALSAPFVRGRRVVHVTFGTILTDPAALGATARAIAALGVLVLVTGQLDEPSPGIVVTNYAPYSLLLPRCDVVVSQAGAGVMLKTLAAGLPHLCLPKAASDQLRNAAACEDAGAGLCLVGAEATLEAIATATYRLLTEPSFTRRARTIADEIAAMPSPADVARALVTTY